MFKSLHIQPLHTCNTATTATKMHSIGGVGAPRMAPCGSGARKSPLLPHANSSSSHTTHSLFPPARRSQSMLIAAAANDGGSSSSGGGGDWYKSSSSSSSRSAAPADSDSSSKKARSRHYYDSTPRYKSRSGDKGDQEPSVTDAVADALSASFGDVSFNSNSSSRTSGGGRGGSSSSRGGRRGARGVSTADDLDDEDEEEDVRGWWEVPREQRWGGGSSSAAADPASLRLEPWQEEQLLLAAASSKKKMQVQTVAANVGLDRTEVLAWVSAFRAKPKSEQAKLLAPLQQQIQKMRAQQQQQSEAAQAAEAARRGRSSSPPSSQQQQQQFSSHQQQQQQEDYDDNQQDYQASSALLQTQQQPTQQQQQQQRQQPAQGLPFSGKNPDTGFVPFTERRAQGLAGSGSSSSSAVGGGRVSKRLSGEVLRTLEGVYARSPWPNRDVVSGLFDLHRLNRDVVLEWFAARRDMDGLPDNPRAAKQLAATAKRAADINSSFQQQQQLSPLLPPELLPAAQQPRKASPALPEQAGVVGTDPQQQQRQQKQRVVVQSLTAREMAALRSGLLSPRKQKGEKLKQELGIKAGADACKQLEISGVTFVTKDGRAGWRTVWRKRRSVSGVPAQQLDFNLWLIRQEQQQEQQEEEEA